MCYALQIVTAIADPAVLATILGAADVAATAEPGIGVAATGQNQPGAKDGNSLDLPASTNPFGSPFDGLTGFGSNPNANVLMPEVGGSAAFGSPSDSNPSGPFGQAGLFGGTSGGGLFGIGGDATSAMLTSRTPSSEGVKGKLSPKAAMGLDAFKQRAAEWRARQEAKRNVNAAVGSGNGVEAVNGSRPAVTEAMMRLVNRLVPVPPNLQPDQMQKFEQLKREMVPVFVNHPDFRLLTSAQQGTWLKSRYREIETRLAAFLAPQQLKAWNAMVSRSFSTSTLSDAG